MENLEEHGAPYFEQVCALALLSIRKPFYTMMDQMVDKEKYMFSFKRRGGRISRPTHSTTGG
jgi:hypothetical protein